MMGVLAVSYNVLLAEILVQLKLFNFGFSIQVYIYKHFVLESHV